MKRRGAILILAGLAAYFTLLALLVAAERGEAQTGIRSFGDAIWYSLVTLTTVGYGDLVPQSPAGRIVGTVFVLTSVGVLAAFFNAAFTFLRSRTVPAIRLSALRRNKCYLFSELNESSETLARDLIRSDPAACAVFCRTSEDRKPAGAPFRPRRTFCFSEDISDILSRTGGQGGKTCFLTGENASDNLAEARKLQKTRAEICCIGTETDELPDVRFFRAASCTARAYWQKWPIRPEERTVLIAGDGELAREFLSEALLINCRVPFQSASYHVFGSWDAYRRLHPELLRAFGRESAGDRLVFHAGAWNESPELPSLADRVIFCGESEEKNREAAESLIRYYPFRGRAFAAAQDAAAPVTAFGKPAEVFTGSSVLRSGLDRRARMLHTLYCRETGGGPRWEELSPFLKASNRASADHLMTKVRLLLPERDVRELTPEILKEAAERWEKAEDREAFRRNEHERWMRFHLMYNWRRGSERSSAERTHPCLAPYEELSPEDREKDDNAWIQIGMLKEEGARE